MEKEKERESLNREEVGERERNREHKERGVWRKRKVEEGLRREEVGEREIKKRV